MTRDEAPAFRPLILGLVFCVAVLAAYIYHASWATADPDQFWHVSTGRYIVEHRAIPHTDVFSWWGIENKRPWAAQEWLFGLLAFAIYNVSGWKGLYLFTALLEGVLVLLVYALTRARGVKPMWSLLVMTAALFGTLWFSVARPQSVTFCLVALTALLLEKGRWPWALLVVVIGVNMHGGVWPLYVLVFALYELPKRWWLPLAAVAVTLVNPNPVRVFILPFEAMLSGAAPRIQEFTPTVLWDRQGDLAMYLALLLAVHGRRIKFRDGLFALAFVVLSLSATRHVQWFYILVLPVMAPYIVRDDIDSSRVRAALSKVPLLRRIPAISATQPLADPDPPIAFERPAATEAPAAGPSRRSRVPELVLIGALSLAVIYFGARAYRTRVDPEEAYPRDMIAYIKVNKISHLFNVWEEGGYLIFKGVAPMIDGRGDPFAPQFAGDVDYAMMWMDAYSLQSDPGLFMRQNKVEYLLLQPSPIYFAMIRDPAIKVVRMSTTHALLRYDPSPSSKSATGTTSTRVTVPGGLTRSGPATAIPATQTPSP